ncbi:MAG: hypothetical protein J3Q66DRAFT_209424 [Benniella sp.]|nr:MAG: hypothetical protein J3Q66DRAFT_209424 [Benniella sp.]
MTTALSGTYDSTIYEAHVEDEEFDKDFVEIIPDHQSMDLFRPDFYCGHLQTWYGHIFYPMSGLRHHQTWCHIVPNCTLPRSQPFSEHVFTSDCHGRRSITTQIPYCGQFRTVFENDCLTRTLLKGKVNFVHMDAAKFDAHAANLNLKGVLARFWVSRTSRMAPTTLG